MGHIYAPWDKILVNPPPGVRVRFWDGWERRSRSTGGWDSMPLAVSWHHTASGSRSDESAVRGMIYESPYKPVANLGIGSDGTVHVMAGGATNTSGRGYAMTFSRGTVPNDGANTRTIGIEMINAGTGGDPYPKAQIDATFWASNRANAWAGNLPSDVYTHNWYTLVSRSNPAGSARKIDPARASDVQGPWRPRDVGNGAGTWDNRDVVAECVRRAEQDQDMPLTDDDIARIWGYRIDNRVNGRQHRADWFVSRIHEQTHAATIGGVVGAQIDAALGKIGDAVWAVRMQSRRHPREFRASWFLTKIHELTGATWDTVDAADKAKVDPDSD